ncbi:hypothetical protein LIER_14198 [Lithospermum erythrorhizon]|uniref:RNase H type-1 domain-containing protein n=1 Tax=Lithospermum erythrorhizon TaxID=34254 RepID=A0AAV3Q3I2_LITER
MGHRVERVRPSIQATDEHESPGSGELHGRMHPGGNDGGARNDQHDRSGEDASRFLYLDGVSNPGGSGSGIVLWSPEGHKIEYALRFAFTATNNDAEYEALANGLSLTNSLGSEHIHIRTDS